MSSPQDSVEGWIEKAQRKFKENPWVPIGCLATTGALVMSAVKMRQGQSQRMNYWLRARVALQGATLVALVGGSMSMQQARAAAAATAEGAADVNGAGAGVDIAAMGVNGGAEGTALTKEQQRQREVERREFAARMQAAAEVVEMEAGAGLSGMRTVKGPVVKDKEGGSK